jgi:hypothetical protein
MSVLRLNSRGATLPLTIIVLAVMSVAVAVTYSRISAERFTGGDIQAQVGAFAVAQTGLNRYLANINDKPGASHDTTMTDLIGGTALVSLRMLRESTTTLLPAVYVITSRGSYTAAKRYNSLTPSAQRTVATYALWTPAPFDLNAGVTSLSGVTYAGTQGTMSGVDACGSAATIAGAAVPTGSVNGWSGDSAVINGSPDDHPARLGTPGTAGTAKDEVDIDWAGIIAGTYLSPNYVFPTWPTAGQFNSWPIVRVNGDLTDPGYPGTGGKGILIVTGDLTISGNDTWDGLILIGGRLTSNGNNTVRGAVVSGLNVKLGIAVLPSTMANGTKTYQYDSCALSRALGHIGSIQRVRNGWTDTWSSY